MAHLLTSRLTLNEFTEQDTSAVLAVLNDPDFIRNVTDRGVRTIPQARAYIRETLQPSYRQHGFGMYRVALAGGTDIGICGLVKRDQLAHPDIGFAFLPPYRSQGYALEAASAVMRFARTELGLEAILGIVNPGNYPSIRLLEKLGLQRREQVYLGKTTEPVMLMAWGGAED